MTLERMLYKWWKRIQDFFQKPPKSHPTFNSSFIQYWYCQNWDLQRWMDEFRMLQNIGISEIILQSIADTKSQHAVYPTEIEGYSSNDIDMVETALAAADVVGMNVRIGLGFNNDWWSMDSHDKAWLEREAEVNTLIFIEISTKYGAHSSLKGWYIPHEFNPLMALFSNQRVNLNQFFKKIAGTIKLHRSETIMIAPFYNALISGPVTLALWSNIVHTVFEDTGIDILALQDSIGAGFNSLDDLDEIYASTKKATEEIGMILYAVTETFYDTGSKNLSAPLQQIQSQMFIESAYVQGFVAFSINHYQNGNEPNQVKNYEELYRDYVNKK